MSLNRFKFCLLKYEWLLPTLILLAVNNIVFYFRNPELSFSYYDYIASIILSALTWWWFYYLASFIKGMLATLARLLLAVVFAIIASFNYLVYIEFGQFISFAMLSFLEKNPDYIKSFVMLYFKEYWIVFLVFILPSFTTLLVRARDSQKNLDFKFLPIIIPGFIFLIATRSDLINNNSIHLPDVTSFISAYQLIIKSRDIDYSLKERERDKLTCKSNNGNVPDIFIIVNESLGRKLFTVNNGRLFNPCMPFLENLVNGNPNNCFIFENSLSSSTATDVSIPSIFTGLSPTAERSQFYKNPLLWDYLKSLNPNYYTIFSSPVDFKWANLESFLSLNKFDRYVRSSLFPGSFINDLGKDEYYSAKAFASAIKEAPKSQPVFGFYFSNSLHSPYQQESAYLNNINIRSSRFCKAQTILDYALNDIISSIFAAGRGENSLIFILGDHGDSDKFNKNGHRLYSFREEYWSTLLLIYASDKLQSNYLKKFDVIRKNTQSLVGSIDIYPSLVDLFSDLNSSENFRSRLDGFSLFQPIPTDRILIGLNTNGLRSWPQEGFGIAKGHTRMIFNNVQGFSFYDLSTDPNQEHDTLNTIDNSMWASYLEIVNKNPELLRVLSRK
jgi:glucan phosphoethanolaminetransferase (alkaline phosphatase superfamily)